MTRTRILNVADQDLLAYVLLDLMVDYDHRKISQAQLVTTLSTLVDDVDVGNFPSILSFLTRSKLV
jgi:histidinol dehydrogenase